VEAEKPQDAQIIFADTFARIADEAHAPRVNIGKPAEIIEQRAVLSGIERIDGEVAPQRVFTPVRRVGDDRAAAEGLYIPAQRGDFDGLAFGDGRHRSMLDSCRDGSQAGTFQSPHNFIGRELCRNIDIAYGLAEKRVAYRAADKARRPLLP